MDLNPQSVDPQSTSLTTELQRHLEVKQTKWHSWSQHCALATIMRIFCSMFHGHSSGCCRAVWLCQKWACRESRSCAFQCPFHFLVHFTSWQFWVESISGDDLNRWINWASLIPRLLFSQPGTLELGQLVWFTALWAGPNWPLHGTTLPFCQNNNHEDFMLYVPLQPLGWCPALGLVQKRVCSETRACAILSISAFCSLYCAFHKLTG